MSAPFASTICAVVLAVPFAASRLSPGEPISLSWAMVIAENTGFPAPPPPGTVPNCSESGVLGAAAGVMGSLQALEVLKEAAGLGTGLAGKILIYKALSTEFHTARLAKDPGCALCGNRRTITAL